MVEFTAGGGAIATVANKSAVSLSVGTASGDHAERRSDSFIPYLPGAVQQISLTHKMNTPQANLQQWSGSCCDTDGLIFRVNGLVPEFVLRSSTSGATVETVFSRYELDGVTPAWRQPDGTLDALDGKGPSGITLDVSRIQLVRFRFLWQGAGFFSFGFKINGHTIWAHHVNVANNPDFDGPFMRRPSLPVCYGIKNIGTTAAAATMLEVCSSVYAEGGYKQPGSEFNVHTGGILLTISSTPTEVLALRVTQNFGGFDNRREAQLVSIDFMAKVNDALFELYHIHSPWYTATHGGETGGTPAPGDTFDNGAGVTGVVVARVDATHLTYRETGGTGIFAAGQTLSNGVWSVTIAANGVPAWTPSNVDGGTEYAVYPAIGTIGGDHVHRVESKGIPAGLASAGGQSALLFGDLSHHNVVHQNYDSSNSDVFVLVARSMTSPGSTSIFSDMTVRETD